MTATLELMVLASALAAAGVAGAVNNAEKQAAVDKGLAWLASQQNLTTGAWNNFQGYSQAGTAAALLAFTEQSFMGLWPTRKA